MKKLVFGALMIAVFLTLPAAASDWNTWGHVTVISISTAPGPFVIQVDVAAGTCAVGTWLTYNPQGPDVTTQTENVKAVYAALLAAHLSGHHVELIGNNAGCVITGVWITN
jgi:hypothetical protein